MFSKHSNAQFLLVVGLFSLAFANVWHWFVDHHTGLSESARDLSSGFFMGMAITLLLIAVARLGRARRSGPQS